MYGHTTAVKRNISLTAVGSSTSKMDYSRILPLVKVLETENKDSYHINSSRPTETPNYQCSYMECHTWYKMPMKLNSAGAAGGCWGGSVVPWALKSENLTWVSGPVHFCYVMSMSLKILFWKIGILTYISGISFNVSQSSYEIKSIHVNTLVPLCFFASSLAVIWETRFVFATYLHLGCLYTFWKQTTLWVRFFFSFFLLFLLF